MNALLRSTAGIALALSAAFARADDFTVSGEIAFHNDVVQIDFSLAAPGNDVRIWTDSWLAGLNFDPTGALWSRAGNEFTLVAAVDDDDTVAPGQGFYDFGFSFATLAAGSYRLTLATAINENNGLLLSQGFAYDAQTPIPIGLWNQPTYDPNANDQKGPFYRVAFTNVDAVTPVPEPAAWLAVAVGLAGVMRRRRVTRA